MANTKTLTMAVSCKHCGGTTMVEKQNVREEDSLTGGITTKMCPKCHKTSNYVYILRNWQFTDIR